MSHHKQETNAPICYCAHCWTAVAYGGWVVRRVDGLVGGWVGGCVDGWVVGWVGRRVVSYLGECFRAYGRWSCSRRLDRLVGGWVGG